MRLNERIERHLARGVLLAAGLAVTGDAAAAIVHSGIVNIPIPLNIDGVYLNLVTGATGTSGDSDLTGNTATWQGSAIRWQYIDPEPTEPPFLAIEGCTIRGNSSDSFGAAVSATPNPPTLGLQKSEVCDNVDRNMDGAFIDLGGTPSATAVPTSTATAWSTRPTSRRSSARGAPAPAGARPTSTGADGSTLSTSPT